LTEAEINHAKRLATKLNHTTVETVLFLDRMGNLLDEYEGTCHEVKVERLHRDAKIMIHNHTMPGSLSTGDIVAANDYSMDKVIAVHKNKAYIVSNIRIDAENYTLADEVTNTLLLNLGDRLRIISKSQTVEDRLKTVSCWYKGLPKRQIFLINNLLMVRMKKAGFIDYRKIKLV
jgi:hypothetical protein